MFPLKYNEPVFRPPSEGKSVLIQVTIGCSNNMCTYCDMYRSKKFEVKDWSILKEEILALKQYFNDIGYSPKRFFLCDGDALAAPTNLLVEVLDELNKSFPSLERVGIYATAQNMIDKSMEELKTLREKKLSILYLGLESGDDKVLRSIVKKNTQEDMLNGSKKVIEAGMKLSIIAMLGIGGKKYSDQHIRETAKVISEISPHYFSFLTTMAIPGTPFYKQVERGTVEELTSKEMLSEMHDILKSIKPNREITFRANHVSNQYPLGGVLPQDQNSLIRTVATWMEQTPEGVYPPKPPTM